jgi:allantoin racemase
VKLWYQSLTRPNAWAGYNRALRTFLDRIKDADTVIDVHGIEQRGGIGDQYHYLEFIETQEVLENVQRASREGYDAVLLGNIGDPGLTAAREIADIPVLGLGETSMHFAAMMGGNFALITGNEKHATRIVENAGRYGLSAKLHGVRSMSFSRLLDLEDGFNDAVIRESMTNEFLAAARAASDDGAEVVIPAIGVLMTLLGEGEVHTVDGRTPILNGVVALVKAGEAAVRMRKLMGGHWTSKRAKYAAPPASQIEELRAAYGDVYPTVPGGKR